MPKDAAAVESGDARLAALAEPYLARPDVDWGRMFSTEGLRVRGKVFALVNHEGNLMAKIPESRADELVAAGSAQRVVMRDREMREWVEVHYDAGEDAWAQVVADAHALLEEITPR